MRAIVVHSGQLGVDEDFPRPVLGRDEVLIHPLLAGICNTDLEVLAGYKTYEGVLGHEFVGQVVDGPADLVGQRVVGEINIACGECDFCLVGMPSQCRERRTLGMSAYQGVFADLVKLPGNNLYVVPDGLSDEQAVFAEPLAAACQVLELTHVRPMDRVVLIGAGKLGLLTAQVLRLTGADLMVVARHSYQQALLEKWQIPSVADARELPVAQADLVVDCTGNETGFAAALDLLKPRGRLVLKSTYFGLPQADLTQVAVKELVLMGNRCGPFEAALRLLSSGLVDVTSMIAARYTLSDALAAFEHAAKPGVLKVLLSP